MTRPSPGHAAPRYWLPAHIHICVNADGAIFLDTRKNRYYGLRPREANALRGLVQDWPAIIASYAGTATLEQRDVRELIIDLIRSELLSATPCRSAHTSHPELPLTRPLDAMGFGTEFDYPITTANLLAFMEAYAGALIDIRFRQLYTVARRIRSLKLQRATRFADDDIERVRRLVSSFRRIRHHFFKADGKCLLHALTLMRYLALYHVYPTFIIGVRTSPWSAHSWVEHNGYTLDATPEKVRSFTPILAV